mgnify:CR=1 FL=1
MLDKKFFNKLGVETKMKFRKHIFDPAGGGKSAKDVFGNDYKAYSVEYREAKKTGKISSQSEKFKDSKAPVLSGALMFSFENDYKATGKGFGFGSMTEQGKVKKLANMGRVVSSNAKPVPDEVAKFIMKEMTKDVKGAFKKIRKSIRRKKINIKIG